MTGLGAPIQFKVPVTDMVAFGQGDKPFLTIHCLFNNAIRRTGDLSQIKPRTQHNLN